MLLPALGRAKAKATGIACISNNKQLILAVHLYAEFPGPLPEQLHHPRHRTGDRPQRQRPHEQLGQQRHDVGRQRLDC
jgi:hypothetical protein